MLMKEYHNGSMLKKYSLYLQTIKISSLNVVVRFKKNKKLGRVKRGQAKPSQEKLNQVKKSQVRSSQEKVSQVKKRETKLRRRRRAKLVEERNQAKPRREELVYWMEISVAVDNILEFHEIPEYDSGIFLPVSFTGKYTSKQ